MEIINNSKENQTDYNQVINYLLKTINSKENNDNKIVDESKPLFLYEFFVFELYVPIEILKNIKQPLLALRFLDFPTQNIEGKIDLNKESILFNQGKSCFFEIELYQLREYLQNEPLYIMFIDMNYGDMKIVASSRVNISIFAFDQFLQYTGSKPPQPRRNILKLYDSVSSKIAEFDLSLIIRREYFKYDSKNNINVNESLINKNKQIFIVDPFKSSQLKSQNNDELFQNNNLFIVPKNNIASAQDDIIKDLKNLKKEAGVNTKDNYVIQEKMIKKTEDLNFDPSKQDYVNNLKNLLEGKEKNPPPLYYNNQRKRESANQIKIVFEPEDIDNDRQMSNKSSKVNLVENSSQIIENKPQNNQNRNVGNKIKKMNEIEKIKETVKMRENAKKIHVDNKNVPNKPISVNEETVYIRPEKNIQENEKNIVKNMSKSSSENYSKKMREVERYDVKNKEKKYTITDKNDKTKSFIDEEDDNLKNNEYYNLFSKIKTKKKESNNTIKDSYINKSANSLSDKSLNSKEKNSEKNIQMENCNSKLYEKFYEISNTHQFEISNLKASQNELVRSYNSLSVSNSIPYEIISGEKILNPNLNKKIPKTVKFEKNETIRSIDSANKPDNLSGTDAIEEDLNHSSIYNYLNYTNRSNSARKKVVEEEILEEYNDFDYEAIQHSHGKFNNKTINTAKEESIIEEEI